jgi:hypothetical protein
VNLYGMVGNDAVNDADILGLTTKARDCASTIRAGHGWHTAPGGPVETGAPKPEPGDRCTAVSCFSGDANKRLPGAVPYPGERFDDPSIPDFIKDPFDSKKLIPNPKEPGFLPGDINAYQALENAIKAAKDQAEKDCGSCCKSITVKVECPGGAGGLDFQGLTSTLKKPVLCGKSYIYNCKDKKWK